MKKIFLLIGFLFFSACTSTPVYKTSYTFTPPKDQGERTCIAQCKSAQSLCSRTCESDFRRCRSDAQMNYNRDEAQCQAFVQQGLKKPHECPTSVYSYERACQSECGCEVDYVDCYQTCGLTVSSKQVCVKNCEKGQ